MDSLTITNLPHVLSKHASAIWVIFVLSPPFPLGDMVSGYPDLPRYTAHLSEWFVTRQPFLSMRY